MVGHRPNQFVSVPNQLAAKIQYTLIEQSNSLIMQSVGLVMHWFTALGSRISNGIPLHSVNVSISLNRFPKILH